MDYRKLFNCMHPEFFNETGIKSMPESWVFAELIMDLRKDTPQQMPYVYPEGISFGEYHGDIGKLKKQSVRWMKTGFSIFVSKEGCSALLTGIRLFPSVLWVIGGGMMILASVDRDVSEPSQSTVKKESVLKWSDEQQMF